jgi:hypothetical protein
MLASTKKDHNPRSDKQISNVCRGQVWPCDVETLSFGQRPPPALLRAAGTGTKPTRPSYSERWGEHAMMRAHGAASARANTVHGRQEEGAPACTTARGTLTILSPSHTARPNVRSIPFLLILVEPFRSRVFTKSKCRKCEIGKNLLA